MGSRSMILVNVRSFECTRCGVCCRTFNVIDRKLTKDDNGVFYNVDLRSRTLSLWRWEADRLESKSEDQGINVDIEPMTFIVDKVGSRAIVLIYHIDQRVCPFLENDECLVWDDRPFTCRSFPFYGERTGLGISSLCPDIVRPPLTDDELKNGRALMDRYKSEVAYLFKDMEVFKTIFVMIGALEKNGVIEWNKEATEEQASSLIDHRTTRIDLFDLIIEEGILPRSKVMDIFADMDSVEGIRGKVKLRIPKEII